MVQVKEFLNYQDRQEARVNDWLKEKGDSIEVIDIKYSVGTFNAPDQEYSGVLIIYKEK